VKKGSDSWCTSIFHNGIYVSGGAARNVRIAARGGMDVIVTRVAERAARQALEEADAAAAPANDAKVIPMRKRKVS
jgi:hypothetical protein